MISALRKCRRLAKQTEACLHSFKKKKEETVKGEKEIKGGKKEGRDQRKKEQQLRDTSYCRECMVKSINFNKDGIKTPRNSKQPKKDMGNS